MREYLGATSSAFTAGVGANSCIGVINPAKSGKILIVEAAKFNSSDAGDAIQVLFTSEAGLQALAGFVALSNVFIRDDRVELAAATQKTATYAFRAAPAAALGIIVDTVQTTVAATDYVAMTAPWIVPPGRGVYGFQVNTNKTLTATYRIRERFATVAELAWIG